jgi:hypothetical protein
MSDEEFEELLQQIHEHDARTSFPALETEEHEQWKHSTSSSQ